MPQDGPRGLGRPLGRSGRVGAPGTVCRGRSESGSGGDEDDMGDGRRGVTTTGSV